MTHERIELADPQAYIQNLIDLVGDRDPVDVMAATPGVFARFVAENSTEMLRTRPHDGKWTPNEILAHVADTEWVFGSRIRTILCDDRPQLVGIDQELWVARQRQNDWNPNELVRAFTDLRRINLGLWRRMSAEDLKREGVHAERGAESLGLMRRFIAGHDLSHIDQLTRYLAAIDRRAD